MSIEQEIKDRRRATAASDPLVLGDREFQMSPLTDKDIAELDSWIQSRCIEIARNSLPPDASQELRNETIQSAIEVAMSMTWLSGRGAKILATVQGMTRLVWVSIRKNHPDVTPAQLQAYMLDPENIQKANLAFSRLNSAGKSNGAANENSSAGKKVETSSV